MKRLPKFRDDEEIFDFFETHSGADFLEGAEEVKGPVIDQRPKKEITTLRLDPRLKAALKQIATHKGIRYQTLMTMWLTEMVRKEVQKRR